MENFNYICKGVIMMKKSIYLFILCIIVVFLVGCNNKVIETNNLGHFLYLEKSDQYKLPMRVMTYDIINNQAWEYMNINKQVYGIKYISSLNLLAIGYLENNNMNIYLYDIKKGKILKKIKSAKLETSTDNCIIYEDYRMKDDLVNQIVILNLRTNQKKQITLHGSAAFYALSNYENELVYSKTVRQYSRLFVIDLENGNERKLIINNKEDYHQFYPQFINDDELIFCSNENGIFQIYKINIETGQQTKIISNRLPCLNPDLSLDRKKILYESHVSRGGLVLEDKNIHIVNIDGSNDMKLLYSEDVDEYSPIWVK